MRSRLLKNNNLYVRPCVKLFSKTYLMFFNNDMHFVFNREMLMK